MKSVRFWGTRGSLPVALTAAGLHAKLREVLRAARGRPLDSDADIERFLAGLPFALAGTYGGHSSCVQIQGDGADYLVCDMGSGLRPFGQAAMAQRAGKAQTFHVFMSHLHWDHIMGLPFFVPGLRIGISNGLVCEKPGKPDSALGGQPMPAWMAWNWRLGRCLVWIRPALTARLALVGP